MSNFFLFVDYIVTTSDTLGAKTSKYETKISL